MVSAVDAVYKTLEEDIYSLKFAPGEQITETDLTIRYGVSRNTVREAVAYLLQNGLLIKEKNKGIFIKSIAFSDVTEIFHLRLLFEREAVGHIHAGADLSALERALDGVEQVDKQANWYEYVAADGDFHRILVGSAGSPRLKNLYETILSEVKLCIYQARELNIPSAKGIYDHRSIFDKLVAGETEAAADIVGRHMQITVEDFRRSFETRKGRK